MMLGTMRLVVLRAFPLVKGYGANLAVKCDGQPQLQSVRGARSATMARKRGRRRSQRLSTRHGRLLQPGAAEIKPARRISGHDRRRAMASGRSIWDAPVPG